MPTSIDEIDGNHSVPTDDILRTRAAIEHMQTKIGKTKELIKGEQTTRDGNIYNFCLLIIHTIQLKHCL